MHKVSLPLRFWSKVDRGAARDCWQWLGCTSSNGYGRFQVDGKTGYAHRVAYELIVGPIPQGLHLDHLCRNRACVNPAHLEPVTSAENTKRSPLTHGRETHCPEGHPYSGDNLYIWTDQSGVERRYCRSCNRKRTREYMRLQRRALREAAGVAQ